MNETPKFEHSDTVTIPRALAENIAQLAKRGLQSHLDDALRTFSNLPSLESDMVNVTTELNALKGTIAAYYTALDLPMEIINIKGTISRARDEWRDKKDNLMKKEAARFARVPDLDRKATRR